MMRSKAFECLDVHCNTIFEVFYDQSLPHFDVITLSCPVCMCAVKKYSEHEEE